MDRGSLVVGTRGSALARWQTDYVIAALRRLVPSLQIETRIIKTLGDQDQVRPLGELGGTGVFTKAIEDALLAGEIDLAVHSLKDLPTETATGLTLAAIMERQDPRDVLVSRDGTRLLELPSGAKVGTSSARRTAQIRAIRPDLEIIPLRGNVDTRLRKAKTREYDAIVLAAAGLIRLGREAEIAEYLPLDRVLPDPGQGALALEVRADDTARQSLVAQLDHAPTRAAVTAERAYLRALGGGCRMPIGAYAENRESELRLYGVVASLDGSKMVRGARTGTPGDAEDVGRQLAARLLAQGADVVLGFKPLAGKRILITRARNQTRVLADKIKELGGTPVEFPTIDFAPLEDFAQLDQSLSRAGEFDWVILTSANGVHSVAKRLEALGLPPAILNKRRLAAIGPATAQALQDLGLQVDFVPSRYLGAQIAAELPVARGQSALLLRADIASDVLATGLLGRGVNVVNVPAYRTVMPAFNPSDLAQVDAVTFTSSSTVRNLYEMLGGDWRTLGQAAVLSIGPVTADSARELGLHVDAIATEHTIEGLVAAMLAFYLA